MIWSHTSYLANLSYNNVIGSDLITRRKTKIGGFYRWVWSLIYDGITIGISL